MTGSDQPRRAADDVAAAFGRGTWPALRRLLRAHRLRLVGASAAFFLKDSPFWALPLVTAAVIDTVVVGDSGGSLLWAGGLGAAVILLNYPTNAVFVGLSSAATRRLAAELRNTITSRLQVLSIGFHARTSAAIAQTKVIRDVENIELMLQQSLPSLLHATGILVGAVLVTAVRAPAFLALYLLTVPLGVVLGRWLRRRAGKRNQELRQQVESLSSQVAEMSALLPLTRAHGLEYVAADRVTRHSDRVKDAALRLDRLNGRFGALSWMSFQLLGLVCLIAAGAASLSGIMPITAGDVVLLSTYFALLTQAITNAFALAPVATRGFESVRSIGEILREPDIEHNEGKCVVAAVTGRVSFRGVHFSYDAEGGAISGLDLEISPGESVAFIGGSGSGKSTTLNLALGFLRPTAGVIELDGRDMQTLDLRTARRFFSVVPQESVLFEGSIRDNVGYGIDGADDERIRSALVDAHAWEFVSALPHGWDTWVGQRGGALSGGQRQRIAIARALVRDPRVLLLDEATSALDTESERAVRAALNRLMVGRTVLVVAHRLATIRSVDRIVVLEGGRIIEVGSHDELIERGGAYRRLVHAED